MATRADVDAHRKVLRDVATLVSAALLSWWQRLTVTTPAEVSDAAAEFLPELVEMFAGASGTVTADWYSTMREAAGVSGGFTAHPAPVVASDRVAASARWATAPLAGDQPDPGKALSRMETATQRYVAQAARDTIAQNVARDPADARWARVPAGATSCAFCLIMASRGAVYESEESAGGDDMHKYHDHCDCQAVPIWSDSPLPEGYDPDALLQQYLDASEKAAGSSLSAIAKQMRVDLGVK